MFRHVRDGIVCFWKDIAEKFQCWLTVVEWLAEVASGVEEQMGCLESI